MCKRIWSCGIAIVGLVAGTASAVAEDSGFYLGASIGEATTKNGEIAFDDSDTGFKVFGGYAFNKYFATELAYVDAGTTEDDFGAINVQFDSSGVIASLVGSLPLGDIFSLYAKAGYAFYETDQTLQLGNVRESDSESESDFTYAAGAAVHLGRFTLRAEYEVVDVPDGDFDAVFVSGLFRF